MADFAAAASRLRRLKGTEVRNAPPRLCGCAPRCQAAGAGAEQLAAFGSDASYDVAARRAFALQALGATRKHSPPSMRPISAPVARRPADHAPRRDRRTGRSRAKCRSQGALRCRLRQRRVEGLSTLDMAYLPARPGTVNSRGGIFTRPGNRADCAAVSASWTRPMRQRPASRMKTPSVCSCGPSTRRTAASSRPPPRPSTACAGRCPNSTEPGRLCFRQLRCGCVAPSSPLAPPPNGGHTIQGGAEIYWRPPGIAIRTAPIFEVFARGFQTWYAENGSSTGWDTTQGSVGVRWKPFATQNPRPGIRLSLSHRPRPRGLAASRGLFAGRGTDLRVDVSEWNYWQAYVEGDYYVSQPERIGLFEARWGRAYRADAISRNLMVTPFLAIGGGYDTAYATPFTSRRPRPQHQVLVPGGRVSRPHVLLRSDVPIPFQTRRRRPRRSLFAERWCLTESPDEFRWDDIIGCRWRP